MEAILLTRPAPSVNEQPSIHLTYWNILQEEDGFSFCGTRPESGFRFSTKIVSFDESTMTGVTESGRKYILVGPEHQDEGPQRFSAARNCSNLPSATVDDLVKYLHENDHSR